MKENEYLTYVQAIISKTAAENEAPYDNQEYLEYAKLNTIRSARWLNTQSSSTSVKEIISQIKTPQTWIVITEAWCGDAAHNIPFIILAARENPLISLQFELRDAAPYRIEQYLTNGGKSIPKLVIQNESGNDLAVWGPRPEGCQIMLDELKAKNPPFDEIVNAVQNWYNADKGVSMQKELIALLETTI